MRIDILTLFPGIFSGYFDQPPWLKAHQTGRVDVRRHNFGDWAASRDEVAIDRDGKGKRLLLRPIVECVNHVQSQGDAPGRLIMLTPDGRQFGQHIAEELVKFDRLVFLCGRFAGFDPTVRDELKPDEISIGRFTMLGGEVATLVIVDTLVRLLPGVF